MFLMHNLMKIQKKGRIFFKGNFLCINSQFYYLNIMSYTFLYALINLSEAGLFK
jgi:hypothetical protein